MNRNFVAFLSCCLTLAAVADTHVLAVHAQGNFSCCRFSGEPASSKGGGDRASFLKKPKLYIAVCVAYAVLLFINTIIYVVGFAMTFQPDNRAVKHNPTRVIFLSLRGITILGTDLFALLAMYRTRSSKFWIAFGFTSMSLVLSIVNSALDPSILSRLDLDFDISCFLVLLVLIREVHQFKKQRERETIRSGVQAEYRC